MSTVCMFELFEYRSLQRNYLPLEEMACRTRWSLFERLSSELGLVFSVQMEGNNDHGRLHTTSRPALYTHAAVHKITKEFNSLPIS